MTSTEAPRISGHAGPRGGRIGLTALPALLLALLPKVTCPACWPAYGSVLSALGLGGLLASPWRAPLLAVFLLPALWLLARRRRERSGRRPLVLGGVGAAASLVGICSGLEAMSIAGSALFVAAVLWSSIARRPAVAAGQRPAAPSPARCCRRA